MYEPEHLEKVRKSVIKNFPMPGDYALADDTAAFDIIEKIRNGQDCFETLSINEMNYAYHIAKLCTDEEFNTLKGIFARRATTVNFLSGWMYCQINAGSERAVSLFSLAYNRMKSRNPVMLDKCLAGRTGLPWDEIYSRSVEIMHVEKLSLEQFCSRYEIIPNTVFYQHLILIYLSKCEKEEIRNNEAMLTSLMANARLEYLRPAIKNYTAKTSYEEMSDDFVNALLNRLSAEDNDNALEISPNLLQMMRTQRFKNLLEDLSGSNMQKLGVYLKISGKIRNIKLLNSGIFTLDFGTYMVIDSSDWKDKAYAFRPDAYRKSLDKWVSEGYPENYWPGHELDDIPGARDTILGVMKSDIVKLGFSDFDILYTRDILTKSHY